MTKTSIGLQDLRRRIYVKAKTEPSWRFWGLYVHICKIETLREAYALAKKNNGSPGMDGVTFEAIEAQGVEAFLEQIQNELMHARKRKGFGWKRWSRRWVYETLGLFNGYRVRRDTPKARTAG